MPALASRFYVYELIDPRDGTVFYVGKGTGRRAHDHTKRARRGNEPNINKAVVIRAILDAGQKPIIRIVRDGMIESAAFWLEAETITAHGIGNLTNIAHGDLTGGKNAAALRGLMRLVFGMIWRWPPPAYRVDYPNWVQDTLWSQEAVMHLAMLIRGSLDRRVVQKVESLWLAGHPSWRADGFCSES